jgi:predicted ATPase
MLLEEQSRRWRRGERVPVENLLADRPALHADAVLDLITNEVLLRQEAGESPRLEEYLERFPDLAEPLRLQFEVKGALDAAPSAAAHPPPDARIEELLLRWVEERAAGRSLTAEELCRDRPELLPAVAARLADLEARHRVLDARTPRGLASAPHPGEPTGPVVPGDAEALPERLGRYRIVARLGAGGMGVVYRAHDSELRRDVAVKAPSLRGPEARARFLREARSAAAVRHPNVCPVYDVGEDDGRPYVVMALVEGESLAERLQRRGRFEDAGAAVALVVQVADALAAVHAAQIVHRDVKPGNVLLDRAGVPLLSDFGLARTEDGEHLSAPGALLGTPAYMPPEQAAPELGAVGPWSDQYSLGVVLYHLLSGRPPFEGPAWSVIHQIATQPVPPPSQHRADLDPALVRLLMKALAQQPQDRYPGVADFAAALRAYGERPAVAPPQTQIHPAPPAQRRRLTVLQCGCDLFDSQAILETLDPEEQHNLLRDFQQLCRDVVGPLAGTVVKATDHGLLVCFGFPLALESPARRAVQAGLEVLERMAGLNEGLRRQHKDLRLSARLAIHSDLAVVTETSGPGEALSIGGPLSPVVDQLERLTAPGTLTISDDVQQLVKGYFACSSLGPQRLGPAGAKAVYRVHHKLAAGNRLDVAGPAGLTPLIGRDREVALLQGCWDQVVEGRGQVVLLVGEPGIGKSRMVHVLKEHVERQSAGGFRALRLEWPCTPHSQVGVFPAVAYWQELLGLSSHESSSGKLDRLTAYLEELHLASAEAVALLAALLLIPLDGRYPPLGMAPQRQKEKTFDLLLDWLRALAARQPVLFVAEDLHWAGPTMMEFLDLLVGQIQGDRILAVLTGRPEFQPSWQARASCTQLTLSSLTRRQIGELLLAKTGLAQVPQDVLELVANRTDGVPLFVEEFAAVLQAGSLYQVGGTPQVADCFEDRVIPATLHDLLLARLERAAGRFEVAQLAATIGREFSFELLQAVAPWEEEVSQQELAKLVDAGLLFVRGRPPLTRYQFKHVLIQDTAYQSLLKKQRQQFHLRIAEVLEQRFPQTCSSQPELLAHHFSEGNAIARAVTYWERAGEAARRRGAAGEVVGHLKRALGLIHTLPEAAERHAQEIQLLLSLGMALGAARGMGVEEREGAYARAYALCLQTGLTAQVVPALFGHWTTSHNRAIHAEARSRAEEMLCLAEREASPACLVTAHVALGMTLLIQGQHPEALRHLEWVVAVDATAELRSALGRYALVDPWVQAHLFLSWALWLLGFPERAVGHSGQALRTAERLGHPFTIGLVLCDGSWVHLLTGNREAARTTAARALALGRENGFVGLVSWASIVEGWALAETGQSEQALETIRQGLEELRAQAALSDRNAQLPLLAEVCARAGRPEEGLAALAEAQAFADATGAVYWQAEIHRLTGELLLQRDPMAAPAAEASFQQALEVSRRQQARSLELRAALSLGRLWGQQGQAQAARELVTTVYSTFTEGFQTHDLQAARTWLEQGGPARR